METKFFWLKPFFVIEMCLAVLCGVPDKIDVQEKIVLIFKCKWICCLLILLTHEMSNVVT